MAPLLVPTILRDEVRSRNGFTHAKIKAAILKVIHAPLIMAASPSLLQPPLRLSVTARGSLAMASPATVTSTTIASLAPTVSVPPTIGVPLTLVDRSQVLPASPRFLQVTTSVPETSP